MKILVLLGSLRKSSLHRRVFEEYKKLAGPGVEFVEGKHDDFPLYNDDLRESGPPETVLRLADQIRSSQGVLFISPEFNYSVPGVLKNTIDWMSKLPNQPFAGKPVSILSASPGKLGGARMQYHLRQIGIFMDMHFLNRPEVMIGEAHKKFNDKGELTDEDTKKILIAHLEHFRKHVEHESKRQH